MTAGQRLVCLALALTAGLCAAILLAAGPRLESAGWWRDPVASVDRWAWDSAMLARSVQARSVFSAAAANKILVLEINEEALAALGRWPWNRRIFAALIRKLDQAGAAGIGLDIHFIESSGDRGADQDLAAAVADSPRVFLNFDLFRDRLRGDGIRWPLMPYLRDAARARWPSVRNRLAYSGAVPDPDGVVRSSPLLGVSAAAGAPAVIKTLPVLLASADGQWALPATLPADPGNELSVGPFTVPLLRGTSRMAVNYGMLKPKKHPEPGEPDPVPFFEHAGIQEVAGLPVRDLAAVVRGRLVLIGTTATATSTEAQDLKATPLGVMPGVYIQANILASLLDRRFLSQPPLWAEVSWTLGASLALGLVLPAIGLVSGVLVILLLAAGLALGAWWAFLAHGWLVSVGAPGLGVLGSYGAILIYLYRVREGERNAIRATFGQYLSREVVDQLLRLKQQGTLELGGVTAVVTVFYSDIRGFTALSEQMTPAQVVAMLNEYLERMTRIVAATGAYLDKFIGDAIMVVFTAPVPRPDDPLRAVRMALDMQQDIHRLRQARAARGEPVFGVGMGINTGPVVLGEIGSVHKKSYTVIGDTVNTAARLYGAAAADQIIISDTTMSAVAAEVECRPLPPLVVKGKAEPLTAYEVAGLRKRPAEGTSPGG